MHLAGGRQQTNTYPAFNNKIEVRPDAEENRSLAANNAPQQLFYRERTHHRGSA